MDLRRFRGLHEAGMSISAISGETGLNWRTEVVTVGFGEDVLSARAEVSRRSTTTAPAARSPLRASGGEPHHLATQGIGAKCSPRERR